MRTSIVLTCIAIFGYIVGIKEIETGLFESAVFSFGFVTAFIEDLKNLFNLTKK